VDKYKKIIVGYAANRADLKTITEKINDFNTETDWALDLSGFRAAWYDQDYAWGGWVCALHDYDDGYSDNEIRLAQLLDEKTKIKKEGGQIKRNMCAYGRAEIRKQIAQAR